MVEDAIVNFEVKVSNTSQGGSRHFEILKNHEAGERMPLWILSKADF